jgi:Rieske Fe-S protein
MPLSRYKKLNKVGGFEQAKLPDGTEVIVARVEDDKFACCSLKCPHANCDVEYDKKVKRFVCPCHNSQFDVNGKVKQGPARKDLQRFDTDPAVVVRTDPAD